MPASALFVTSPAPFWVLSPTATPMATIPAAVTASIHRVERSVVNLIHSIRATWRKR
jgi:hypothetical protein